MSQKLGTCTGGVRATATDHSPARLRDFTGLGIERREAGTGTWSVVLHQSFDPRPTVATASVCDALPADGRTRECRAATYDAAGNLSPYRDIRALTAPAG